MGVYYYFVNFTKREMFYTAAFGGNCKIGGVGRTLATRAFGLLLAGPHIEANAFLLMFHNDGFEALADAAQEDKELYCQICDLIVSHQAPELHYSMHEYFGTDYLKQYKKLSVEYPRREVWRLIT